VVAGTQAACLQHAQTTVPTACTVPLPLPLTLILTLTPTLRAQAKGSGEWWQAELQLPMQTGALNFVLNYFEHYDNNDFKDYAIKVCAACSGVLDYVLYSYEPFEHHVTLQQALWQQQLEEQCSQDVRCVQWGAPTTAQLERAVRCWTLLVELLRRSGPVQENL